MIVEYAVPIITTIDGPREQVDCPCDTETRLYLEQSLDLGDAEMTPIIDVPGCMWMGTAKVTHRIVTINGGVFHARMVEGSREWPGLKPPNHLEFLFRAIEGIEMWRRANVTQIAALNLLEEENAELRRELGR